MANKNEKYWYGGFNFLFNENILIQHSSLSFWWSFRACDQFWIKNLFTYDVLIINAR